MKLRTSILLVLPLLRSLESINRTREKWQLSDKLFEIATRAVSDDRANRQQTIRQFTAEWGDGTIMKAIAFCDLACCVCSKIKAV